MNYSPEIDSHAEFPPKSSTEILQHKIITNYCEDMNPSNYDESGCAVCGGLTLLNSSLPLSDFSYEYLEIDSEKCTRIERKHSSEPITYIQGPVIDNKCKIVCLECAESVRKKKLPKKALANGLWLGEVPSVLT